jgi:hypothetical protein
MKMLLKKTTSVQQSKASRKGKATKLKKLIQDAFKSNIITPEKYSVSLYSKPIPICIE